ncbi:MAG: putative acetyltransferase [Actinomycetota bacterium]|jgi:putative acetyltransferase|nr:putative acetyltransferase [Actinomycetota bacterium]
MLIRREIPADADAIAAVHTAAFKSRAEPGAAVVESRLVGELRRDGDLIAPLSLVAVQNDVIVGHVCCSPARLGDNKTFTIGLGPLGVLPENQRAGVGKALMHAVIAAADALGFAAICLLGDPGYYSRYGFVLSSELGIEPPDGGWAQHFQVRTLAAYAPGLRGTFHYCPAFDRL